MAMLVANPQNSGHPERSNRELADINAFLKALAHDLGISISDLGILIGSPIHGNEVGTSAELYVVNNSIAIQNLRQVVERGRQVWGDDYPKFIAWLHLPIRSLNGKKPITLLNAAKGIEKVLKIIGRIEHGVYS
jgi:hypothetical protein